MTAAEAWQKRGAHKEKNYHKKRSSTLRPRRILDETILRVNKLSNKWGGKISSNKVESG